MFSEGPQSEPRARDEPRFAGPQPEGPQSEFDGKTIWAESCWKRVVLWILLSDRSQSVYEHRLDIKEPFCHKGVTNESL